MPRQLALFDQPDLLPQGFRYRADLLSAAEEQALVADMKDLPFKEFEFHGFLGKRRTVSFGWRYDFSRTRLERTEEIPDFLLPLRDKAAAFAGLPANAIAHALLTEYGPGATIGWHRDRPAFADVIGISLVSPCVFRFRRKAGTGWERVSAELAPRSIYVMQGPARHQWEHSIPAVESLRYSITFRTMKNP
jgi:alkylated DNA repair dioxygenase AlkB